jgi:protein-arginine kinase activator protein McsA
MTNLERARQNARDGAELGDLRRRENEAALIGRHTMYHLEIIALQSAFAEAKRAGNFEEAAAIKAQGEALYRAHYGLC